MLTASCSSIPEKSFLQEFQYALQGAKWTEENGALVTSLQNTDEMIRCLREAAIKAGYTKLGIFLVAACEKAALIETPEEPVVQAQGQ